VGTPSSGRLGYLGDKERFSTGGNLDIIRMGVRLYDPAVGRFLQIDPLPGGSANGYDYSYQDPINGSDVNGEYCILGTHGGKKGGCRGGSLTKGAERRAIDLIDRPYLTDLAAGTYLRAWTGGQTRACGTSGSGRVVYCVEFIDRLPSASAVANAVTYGHYIFCKGSCAGVIVHELVHVGQWEAYGDFFGAMYLAEAAAHGTGCDNKFERPAYAAGAAAGEEGCP